MFDGRFSGCSHEETPKEKQSEQNNKGVDYNLYETHEDVSLRLRD